MSLNISKFKSFHRQLALLAMTTVLANTTNFSIAHSAEEHVTSLANISVPKDRLNSVMWEDIVRDFIMKDKDTKKIVMNDQILVQTPSKAEDQLSLPVHVDARSVKDVRKIVVFADLNPIPQVLSYEPDQAEARLSFRIKLAQATPIRALVLDKQGVWHVNGTYIDAAGGGCIQPAVAYGTDDWVKRLAEVRGKIWRKPGEKSSRMRISIRHPMDTGLADGIPAFYLKKLEMKGAGGENIGNLYIKEPLSENPTLTLFPILKEATSSLRVKGRDNEGNLIDVKIPAPVQSSALID